MQGKIDLFSDTFIWTPIFNSSSGYSLLTNPSSSDPITKQSCSTFEGFQEDSVSRDFKRTWSEKTSRRLGLKRLQEELVSKDFKKTWSPKTLGRLGLKDFRRTWSQKTSGDIGLKTSGGLGLKRFQEDLVSNGTLFRGTSETLSSRGSPGW